MTFEGLIISWPCFCPAFRHIRQPWDQQNEVTEPGWMMETNLMLFTPAPKGHSNFQQHNQQISENQFLVELSSRGNSTKMETVSRHEKSRPRPNVSNWTFVQRLSLILVTFCHSFDCLCFITMMYLNPHDALQLYTNNKNKQINTLRLTEVWRCFSNTVFHCCI